MARKANSLDNLFTTVTRAPTPDEFSEFDNLEELLRTPISFGDQPHHQHPAIGDETPTLDWMRGDNRAQFTPLGHQDHNHRLWMSTPSYLLT